ncbi:hypothetical protein MBM_06711 [Drepanopeziza brunnea f. sp. 'multigermtubi' MB_m1]|uniref:2EXR domain-containing protein n=1 Tax=Marssonina brunnea f. sp. multigermtubi (strain MB_m1) TaxID=1072389 RepID=K1WC37_MARBU|nr:uncharacterized protein MBM_06711 [Drepanopeziza brunnea f. sp. 'multigermtubi' MB_m1]EKD14950.1 hypothetical protein MBM_06711 [Drepanopeziza brunnea f. sp. 'multigermtubi' MB_m1]
MASQRVFTPQSSEPGYTINSKRGIPYLPCTRYMAQGLNLPPRTTESEIRENSDDYANAILKCRNNHIWNQHLQDPTKGEGISYDQEFVVQAPNALTEFHLFPKLPAEVRIKIWKFVALTPRIVPVELVLQPNPPSPLVAGRPSHSFYPYIAPRFRYPAVLCASFEARKECLQYYELRFMYDRPGDTARYAFNKHADYLYFGADYSRSCDVSKIFYADLDVPRVAISLPSLRSAKDILLDLHGRYNPLHSFPLERQAECLGLKEVRFVVQTPYSYVDPTSVDANVVFHSTCSHGVTDKQRILRAELAKVDNDLPVGTEARTGWVGADTPSFEFTWILYEKDKVSVERKLSGLEVRKIMGSGPEILGKLAESADCQVSFLESDQQNGYSCQFSIQGPARGVERMKSAVQEVLVSKYTGRLNAGQEPTICLQNEISRGHGWWSRHRREQ